MATLLDDLDDEEIEASLLWTDDEDGDYAIDPVDEELLLSEPPSDKCDLKTGSFSPKTVLKCSSNLEITDPNSPSKISNLTDEVDLDVTLNTRDVLDTSVTESEGDTSCLDSTIIEDENSASQDFPKIDSIKLDSTSANSIVVEHPTEDGQQLQTDDPKLPSDLGITNSPEVKIILNQPTPESNPIVYKTNGEDSSNSHNGECKEEPLQTGDPFPTKLGTTPQISESEYAIIQSISTPESNPPINKTNDKDSLSPISGGKSISELKDTLETPVDPSTNKQNADEQKSDKENKIAITDHDTAKSPVQGSKRSKSLSSELIPPHKRFRQASGPPIPQNQIGTNKTKPQNAAAAKLDSEKDTKHVSEPPKKKTIVNFSCKNYSLDLVPNELTCKNCKMKFKEQSKFESHLVANHAMALTINDFDIDLHQYYRQKKDKLLSQLKHHQLPKLHLQDGLVDQGLVDEYHTNVAIVTAHKHPQYFCKICENIYVTKNLIIEHIKSAKHIITRSKL